MRPLAILVAVLIYLPAQWSPTTGQWGKADALDVRVMTWNVSDAICSTAVKQSGANAWTALARIVATLKPDVLILQETADNNGNGTGSSMDSVANLTTTLNLFLHGGTDTFNSGSPAVTAYVQLYAPGYDLPFIFASSSHDNYNRNVILSRWAFADLNGDTRSQLSDIPTVSAHLYAGGGTGGIRGFMFAEIDLPAASYAGDLVVGNAHLKAGSTASDHTQRVNAARNVAYYVDHMLNGAGLGVPDPFAKIADSPPATSVLNPNTPVVLGGDWNEDEWSNNDVGPALWLSAAQNLDSAGGTDGTDRNRTDMLLDATADVFTLSTITGFGSKYDYLLWQDSIAAMRNSFVFNVANIPTGLYPSTLMGWPGAMNTMSTTASDHRPVIVDLILPRPLPCNTAAVDLGFAKLGGNMLFPRFAACGGTAAGAAVNLSLSDAAATAVLYVGLGSSAAYLPIAGGTIIPAPLTVAGPFFTDPTGAFALSIANPAGTLVAQWAIVDPGASFGLSFSNALSF
jgi:endonuclease/exonuclease/phosphatase family metal-dependent hydrolase